MLSLAILLAVLQATPSSNPSVLHVDHDEITVIGRKLRDWRGSLKTRDGVARCVTKRSTGDREIDKIGCDAMLTCLPKFEGEFKRVPSTSRDKASQDRIYADINKRLTICVEDRHDSLVEMLADRRTAGRL